MSSPTISTLFSKYVALVRHPLDNRVFEHCTHAAGQVNATSHYKEQERCRLTHRAVKHHTVAIANTLNMGRQIQTDSPVANSIHGLRIKEVMGSRWNKEGSGSQMKQ